MNMNAQRDLPLVAGRKPVIHCQDGYCYWIGEHDSPAELYRDGVWRSDCSYGTDKWPTREAAEQFVRSLAEKKEPKASRDSDLRALVEKWRDVPWTGDRTAGIRDCADELESCLSAGEQSGWRPTHSEIVHDTPDVAEGVELPDAVGCWEQDVTRFKVIVYKPVDSTNLLYHGWLGLPNTDGFVCDLPRGSWHPAGNWRQAVEGERLKDEASSVREIHKHNQENEMVTIHLTHHATQ